MGRVCRNSWIPIVGVLASLLLPVVVFSEKSGGIDLLSMLGTYRNASTGGEMSVPNNELDILLACCEDKPVKPNRTHVTLGYLSAVKGDLSNR